jgi:hypothetical protein
MSAPVVPPRIAATPNVVETADPAAYIRMAFEGGDLTPVIAAELEKLAGSELAPGPLINLATLYQLVGRREDALRCQAIALEQRRAFRQSRPVPAGAPPLRLLALVAPGDLMTNTPVDLMLEGRAVAVTKLFLVGGEPPPAEVPDHDVALFAISESDETRELLRELEPVVAAWPRPILNAPAPILGLGRDRLHKRLAGAPGVSIPPTERLPRETLAAIAAGRAALNEPVPGADFPIIARPVGSHAGKGLEKLDTPAALAGYLEAESAAQVYISPFVDYAGPDGRFRKYRIAFFGGRAFLGHMAVGDRWMVHYLNAGMDAEPAKRAEEAAAMAGFDTDFAARHAEAFASLHARLGLDYFAIDAAELPDGSLLVFEADVAMIFHDLDPAALYPYKKPQMMKLFDGFEALLRRRAGLSVNQV